MALPACTDGEGWYLNGSVLERAGKAVLLLGNRLLTCPFCLAENSPGHGKSPDHKGRVSSLLHKPEFPDGEMMEVLI